jgi:hypothetical protein
MVKLFLSHAVDNRSDIGLFALVNPGYEAPP